MTINLFYLIHRTVFWGVKKRVPSLGRPMVSLDKGAPSVHVKKVYFSPCHVQLGSSTWIAIKAENVHDEL